VIERNEQGKKTKALWQAYEIAAEGHDLEYFKTMLKEHELHVMQEHERAIEAEAKKLAKKDKKGKKDDDGDVEMEDVEDDATEKKKPAKKRKKSLGDGGEEDSGKVSLTTGDQRTTLTHYGRRRRLCSRA
jgi:hypothetical protein